MERLYDVDYSFKGDELIAEIKINRKYYEDIDKGFVEVFDLMLAKLMKLYFDRDVIKLKKMKTYKELETAILLKGGKNMCEERDLKINSEQIAGLIGLLGNFAKPGSGLSETLSQEVLTKIVLKFDRYLDLATEYYELMLDELGSDLG